MAHAHFGAVLDLLWILHFGFAWCSRLPLCSVHFGSDSCTLGLSWSVGRLLDSPSGGAYASPIWLVSVVLCVASPCRFPMPAHLLLDFGLWISVSHR